MSAAHRLVATLCPICYHSVALPFFDGGEQPLATLGWATSAEEAHHMACYPLDYVQCPRCSHVWNRSFTYETIPYQKNPNRMYNRGTIWEGHLAKTRNLVIAHLPPSPTVMDIGCGEGHFVRGLAEALQTGRFVGFDPNTTQESNRDVEFHGRYFEPFNDMPTFAPDLLVMRHVLEHLTDPAAFVEQLAWGAVLLRKQVLFFAEMPCIDRVLTSKRLVDFYYEHPSQFTTRSFRTLMEKAGEILTFDHGYDAEVVYALVRLGVPSNYEATATTAMLFSEQAGKSKKTIQDQLASLLASGKRIAIWGGTGKAATFIHQFAADAISFPLVVDSDPDKVGTYVARTGQLIQFRDALKGDPVSVIIIPTQWRAKDIVDEMKREGIQAKQILIEHDGRLINFEDDAHPYK